MINILWIYLDYTKKKIECIYKNQTQISKYGRIFNKFIDNPFGFVRIENRKGGNR